MTTTALSERQRRMLAFIREFIAEVGYPPSHRDIMAGTDITSTSVVSYNLHRLREQGIVEFGDDYGRTLRLVDDSPLAITIPHAGWLRPTAPMPQPGEGMDPPVSIVPSQLMGARQAHAFAVTVQGSSFVDSGHGIADGDVLIVSRFEPELEPDATYITWDSRTQMTEIVRGCDLDGLGEARTISARLRCLVRVHD